MALTLVLDALVSCSGVRSPSAAPVGAPAQQVTVPAPTETTTPAASATARAAPDLDALSPEERAYLRTLSREHPDLRHGFTAAFAPRGMPADPEDEERGCGEPTRVDVVLVAGSRTGGELERHGVVPVTHCRGFFTAVHQRLAATEGVVPYRLAISPGAVTFGGQTLLDLGQECERLLEPEWACRTDFLHLYWSVLSLVGPIVSLGQWRSQAGGGGPPYSEESWSTWDLRTGWAASLDALAPESALVHAFAHSTALRENLEPAARRRLDRAETLEEVWAAWSPPGRDEFGAYVFAVPDGPAAPVVNAGEELLRFGFRFFTVGMSPNSLNVLDLAVVPRPEAEAWFAQARQGAGWLSAWEDRASDAGWQ